MERTSFEAVAKVVGVPVGRVRTYVERLKGRLEGPEPVQSAYKLATIKEVRTPEVAPLATIEEVPPLEAAAPKAIRWELDDLYAKWVSASSPDERAAISKDTHRAALKLGSAVRWRELHENDPDFPSDVAAAIVKKLPDFKGKNKAKFSTFAFSIGRRKATEWKRKLARYKKKYDVYADYEGELEKYESKHAWSSADARLLKADLSKGLSREEKVLLELRCEGRNSLEIAQVLEITQHAAESRIRRLRNKLSKKIKSE